MGSDLAIVYQARPFLALVFYMRGEGLARYTNLAITQHTCIKTMQSGDCMYICMYEEDYNLGIDIIHQKITQAMGISGPLIMIRG